MEEIKTLLRDFKNHLEENQGEVVYWGDPISLFPLPLGRGQGERNTSRMPSSSLSQTLSPTLSLKGEGEKLKKIELLQSETVGDCHLCPLGDTRIKLVFGVGNPESDVMFVGEGPGFDEDRKGEPFVGKAGQLLDKILAAIGLDRSTVYIANVVKCHPMVDPTQPDKRGNDRPPASEEIEKCRPFLIEQIRIIAPRLIVTLGGTATKALLGTNQGITSLRGKFFDLKIDDNGISIPVLPTFHPAALLRDESLKKAVWEDMKKLRDLLNQS